jgi:integrase
MKTRAKKGNAKASPRGRGCFHIVEFTNPSGATAYRVAGWTMDSQRVRENFKTHAEAVARMQELEIQSANLQGAARPVVTRLTADQAAEAEAAFAQLGDRPLLNAVRFYLDNYREPVAKITIADAFQKFITEREAGNLRPQSLANLRIKTRELVARHGRQLVSEITHDALRPLIFKPSRGPVSRDNHRRAIHAFFEWAHKQGYCAANPAANIAPVKSDRHDPAILTPDQTARLLSAASSYRGGLLVPYVALGVFAGLRPTELARVTWERIDLEERTITLGADMAKMRSKRLVEMNDNLVAWLAPFAASRQPIVGANWRKDFDAVKEAAGWGTPTEANPGLKPWPQDMLRHTAISYHLARCQHEGQTATWAGNSPTIVQKHYKGLVKPADAAKFWTITPETVKGEIVQFPAQAAA